MSSVKRILVVVDPTTEQQPAVQKAKNSREARLAKHIASGEGA